MSAKLSVCVVLGALVLACGAERTGVSAGVPGTTPSGTTTGSPIDKPTGTTATDTGADDDACAPDAPGDTRACENKNDFGSCFGLQTCDAVAGWGVCDAETPAVETCDGLDNNCDGQTDEGFADTDGDTQPDCVDPDDDNDGDPDETDCAPFDPGVHVGATDTCNGVDDDCDGVTDPCDDGDPCTTDVCDPTDGCSSTSADGDAECDDGDPCTTGSTCADGVCGGGGPTVCDDGDACTQDVCDPEVGCVSGAPVACDDSEACTADSCDSASGCVFAAVADATACDDGSDCTLDDACQGGVCTGAALECVDDNPCVVTTCIGGDCLYAAAPDGEPCDDGVECTVGDTCVGGSCGSPPDGEPLVVTAPIELAAGNYDPQTICVKGEGSIRACGPIDLDVGSDGAVVIGGGGIGPLPGAEGDITLEYAGYQKLYVLIDTSLVPVALHLKAPGLPDIGIETTGPNQIDLYIQSGGKVGITAKNAVSFKQFGAASFFMGPTAAGEPPSCP